MCASVYLYLAEALLLTGFPSPYSLPPPAAELRCSGEGGCGKRWICSASLLPTLCNPYPTLLGSFQWTIHPHQPKDRQRPAPFHPKAQTEQRCLTDRYAVAWFLFTGKLFWASTSQPSCPRDRQHPVGEVLVIPNTT